MPRSTMPASSSHEDVVHREAEQPRRPGWRRDRPRRTRSGTAARSCAAADRGRAASPQSSRWRLANSRDAMPTATAASSAASSATRFRNFDARSSVWRTSGRPVASDSMRRPRKLAVLTCASAHSVNFCTAASPSRVAATGEPVGDAARGLHEAGRGQIGLVQHHARRERRKAGATVGLVSRWCGRCAASCRRSTESHRSAASRRRAGPDRPRPLPGAGARASPAGAPPTVTLPRNG